MCAFKFQPAFGHCGWATCGLVVLWIKSLLPYSLLLRNWRTETFEKDWKALFCTSPSTWSSADQNPGDQPHQWQVAWKPWLVVWSHYIGTSKEFKMSLRCPPMVEEKTEGFNGADYETGYSGRPTRSARGLGTSFLVNGCKDDQLEWQYYRPRRDPWALTLALLERGVGLQF